jgi:hypothetical protein
VQVHRKRIAELAIQTPTLGACQTTSPVSIARVWLERVGEAIVQATGIAVGEAERENFERRDAFRYEPAPQTVVKDRTPIRRGWAWRSGSRDQVESLTEVGRVLVKMHQRPVEWLVDFICGDVISILFRWDDEMVVKGAYRSNPTASQTRARVRERYRE